MIGKSESRKVGKSESISSNKCIASGLSVLRTFGLIFLFVACTNKDKVPTDVLSQEDMGKVMWDMIQADRFSLQYLTRDTSLNIKTENFKLYEQVFQVHKITRDEFIHSYKFYLSRPDLNKVIFDTLSARGERRRTEIYKKDSTDKKLADSLAKKIGDSTAKKIVDSAKKVVDSIKKSGDTTWKRPPLIKPHRMRFKKPVKPVKKLIP
jgi:hypothetical protein